MNEVGLQKLLDCTIRLLKAQLLVLLVVLLYTYSQIIMGWSVERYFEYEGISGVIFNDTGVMICDNELSCFHEIGHFSDDELGKISQSDEFEYVVSLYVSIYCEDSGELICTFPGINGNPMRGKHGDWGGLTELYAEMYVSYIVTHTEPHHFFTEYFNLPY